MDYKELLELALEVLTCDGGDDDPGHRCSHCDDYVDRNGLARAQIREALSRMGDLPRLPDPDRVMWQYGKEIRHYTEQQMKEYAEACLNAQSSL